MSLNRKFYIAFLYLFLFSACGINTGGENIKNLILSTQKDAYTQTPSGTMQAFLMRHTSYNDSDVESYSRLILNIKVPTREARNKIPLKDIKFALWIQEINPGEPTTNETDDIDLDEGPPPLQDFMITFGDQSEAYDFTSVQPKGPKQHMVVTNMEKHDGIWRYNGINRQFIKHKFNTVANFLFDIQNIYGGCVWDCTSIIAIPPVEDNNDPRFTQYQIVLWIVDSPEIINRGWAFVSFKLGYINRQKQFVPFSKLPSETLEVDFQNKETQYEYIQRKKREDSNYTGESLSINTVLKNI